MANTPACSGYRRAGTKTAAKADYDKMTTNTAPNGYLRDSPRSQLRYLPRLLAFMWRVAPATVALLIFISAIVGLIVVAEVHALRRLVETAQEVIQGGAPLIDAVVWAGLFRWARVCPGRGVCWQAPHR